MSWIWVAKQRKIGRNNSKYNKHSKINEKSQQCIILKRYWASWLKIVNFSFYHLSLCCANHYKGFYFSCKFCVAVAIGHLGNRRRHAEFFQKLKLERLSQVNPVIPTQVLPRNEAATTQTRKCGFDFHGQCILEIRLSSFHLQSSQVKRIPMNWLFEYRTR